MNPKVRTLRKRTVGQAVTAAIGIAIVGATPALAEHRSATHHSITRDMPSWVLTGQARVSASATTPGGKTVRVWRVPTSQGGECVFRQLDAGTASFTPNLGGSCHATPGRAQPAPVLATLVWVSRDDAPGYYLVLQGSLGQGAKQVQLVNGGARTAVATGGSDFAVVLSEHADAGSLPADLAAAVLEVSGASGTVVERVALHDLLPAE